MHAVLDSNVFIFSARSKEMVFTEVIKLAGVQFQCSIPQMVLTEVVERLRNLEGKQFASFARYLLQSLPIPIIADELIPEELMVKYKQRGAKSGDATIAAFVEWVKADYLVTENCDFLQELPLDFKVMKTTEFKKVLLGERV